MRCGSVAIHVFIAVRFYRCHTGVALFTSRLHLIYVRRSRTSFSAHFLKSDFPNPTLISKNAAHVCMCSTRNAKYVADRFFHSRTYLRAYLNLGAFLISARTSTSHKFDVLIHWRFDAFSFRQRWTFRPSQLKVQIRTVLCLFHMKASYYLQIECVNPFK